MGNVGALAAELVINDAQASGALKKLETESKAAEAGLTRINTALRQTTGTFGENSKGVDENTSRWTRSRKEMGEGEKALRGFYREQRLQNRTFRESVGTLTSLAFAFTLLSQSQDDAGKTTQSVAKGLMVGVAAFQAVEFSLFAVSRAGATMGGTMGAVLTRMGAMIGPIGAVVAIGASLATFFMDTEKKAKAANIELEKTQARFEALDRTLKARGANVASMTDEMIRTEINQRMRNLKEIQRLLDQNQVERGKEQTDERKTQLENDKKLLEEQFAFEMNYVTVLSKEQGMRKRVGEITAETISKTESLAGIEQVILDLKHKQERATGAELEATNNLIDVATKRQQEMTSNDEKEKDRASEEFWREENRRDAEYRANVKKRIEEASAKQKEAEKALEDMQITGIADEEQRELRAIDLKYQRESEKIAENLGQVELSEEQQTTVRLAKEQEVATVRTKYAEKSFQQQMDGIERIGQAFEIAFGQSQDEGIQKMLRMIQLAIQFARIMQAANARPGGADTGDVLGMLGSAIGFLSIFADEGGIVGGLQKGAARPAVVHVGETILPTHKMGLAQALQHVAGRTARTMRFDQGGVVGDLNRVAAVAVGGAQGENPLLFLLRTNNSNLISAIRELQIKVNLLNTLDGQTFLRKQFPDYERFNAQKKLTAVR